MHHPFNLFDATNRKDKGGTRTGYGACRTSVKGESEKC